MADMSAGEILTERRDGVLLVRIHRPDKKNALTRAMYAALTAALEQAADDPAIRVAVLTGGGDSFTTDGKAAPPMPTMPASAMRFFNSSGEAFGQSSAGMGSAAKSSPSLSRITAGSWLPAGPRHVAISFTVPLVGA